MSTNKKTQLLLFSKHQRRRSSVVLPGFKLWPLGMNITAVAI
jgi:hypothetical protein